jgi:tRNA G18 (ribose-2'-O)-methylase SpoU
VSLAYTGVVTPINEVAAADPLHAATAAALLLYEAVRQRAAT